MSVEEHFLNLLEDTFGYCSHVGTWQCAVGSHIVGNLFYSDGGIADGTCDEHVLLNDRNFLVIDSEINL